MAINLVCTILRQSILGTRCSWGCKRICNHATIVIGAPYSNLRRLSPPLLSLYPLITPSISHLLNAHRSPFTWGPSSFATETELPTPSWPSFKPSFPVLTFRHPNRVVSLACPEKNHVKTQLAMKTTKIITIMGAVWYNLDHVGPSWYISVPCAKHTQQTSPRSHGTWTSTSVTMRASANVRSESKPPQGNTQGRTKVI